MVLQGDHALVLEMDGDTVAPRLARHFVAESLDAWHCPNPDHLAELLTSELVTNVVQHTASHVVLEVCVLDDILTISASDASPAPPVTREITSDAEYGRGMRIVSELSRDWGVVPTQAGKTVWLELPLDCDEIDDGTSGGSKAEVVGVTDGVADGVGNEIADGGSNGAAHTSRRRVG
jgi:anti-sigma regulatory factor (Ser/Thr protein kinase)